MFLLLSILAIALAIGFLRGGRLSNLGEPPLAWWWLALVGVLLQLVPLPGRTPPVVALLVSYSLLGWFAWANRSRPGFWLVLAGLCANFIVVAANGGMPVSREALDRAHAQDTLQLLIDEGGAKHHLAQGDVLMPLADVIPIGEPYRNVISIGDVGVYLGIGWFIVASMRKRTTPGDGEEALDYLPDQEPPIVESSD